MPNQISPEIKDERSHQMILLGEEMQKSFLSKQVGKTLEVLFENPVDNQKDSYEGYTPNYLKVTAFSKENIENEILKVKIKEVKNDTLIGDINSSI